MEYTQIKTLIHQLPFDIKLEVLLCELYNNKQLDPTLIKVKPIGIFYRGGQRDIHSVEIFKNEFEDIEKILFELSREGLFDTLPSGLFFNPVDRKYKKTAKEIRASVQVEKREEKAARDFFFPIEQEFYNQRIQLEQKEREVFSGFTDEIGRNLFIKEFWQLELEGVPEEQLSILLYFLPLAFNYKGNLEKIEQIFSVVLKEKITIVTQIEAQLELEERILPGLGDTFLGVNMVLGKAFQDGFPEIHVNVGPIIMKETMRYFPGGPQQKLLDVLCRFFLPAEVNMKVNLLFYKKKSHALRMQETNGNTAIFKLDEKVNYYGRLGVNTYL